MVHAHFNDSSFMTFFQTEQCQRHTKVIIEISQCPQSIVFLRKYRSNHILCGSLAYTACDTHNGNIEQAAIIFCQLEHSRSRVFHQKQHAAIFRCHFTFRKTCGNAFFHAAFQVIMSVGIFAFQRHKEAFFPCLTGVLCHMADGFLLCTFQIRCQNPCMGGIGNFLNGQFFHKQSSPNAFRTSSTSSK